jgi:hypothetical protein
VSEWITWTDISTWIIISINLGSSFLNIGYIIKNRRKIRLYAALLREIEYCHAHFRCIKEMMEEADIDNYTRDELKAFVYSMCQTEIRRYDANRGYWYALRARK